MAALSSMMRMRLLRAVGEGVFIESELRGWPRRYGKNTQKGIRDGPDIGLRALLTNGPTHGLQPTATDLLIGAYMTQSTAVRQLSKRLGRRVNTSEAGRWAASFDSSKISFMPEAVVTPATESDVGIVL